MMKPNRTTSYLLFVSLWTLLGANTLQAIDFTVTNVNDSGAGSLREAIIAANGAPNGSNIVFAIPGNAPYNIVLNTALPVITGHQTAIEGTTQPGIVLSPAGSLAYGISIQANSCTIRGLEITGFDVGIVISGSHCNNIIHECTIANNLLKGIDTGTSTNTQIRQNSMFCNGNMPPGGDPLVPSPNAKVPPVILSASTTLITGTATYSAPTPTFLDNIVEIFVVGDTSCADAEVQGKTYLTQAIVAPNGTWSVAGNFPQGAQLTATVTNPAACPIPCTSTAGFTYDVDHTNVFFYDQSSNNPVSWFWDFGDGYTSTEQDPAHGYLDYGTYYVCHTAGAYVNGIYCEASYCDSVDVPACDLVAEFDYYVYGGTTEVDFGDLSSGNPTSGLWDFGDGETSTEPYPTHVYSDFGTYNVCLTVYKELNGMMCEDTKCYEVEVLECPLYADWDGFLNPNTGEVQFYDYSTGGPTNWYWDFGDGFYSNAQDPLHVFSPGTYTICLYIDNYGSGNNPECEDYLCAFDVVIPDPCADLVADFEMTSGPGGNCCVQFTDYSSGGPTDYYWEFGYNNETSTLQNPEYCYPFSLNSYTVRLTISKPGCDDVYVEKITGTICDTYLNGDTTAAKGNGSTSTAALLFPAEAVTSDFSPLACIAYVDTIDISICANEVYVFYGDTLNTTGTYDTMFTAMNGCDTTLVLNLTVLDTSLTVLDVAICENETFMFYGESLNMTGTYDTVFTAFNGCDSTIVLNLTVQDTAITELYETICANETYDFYGSNLSMTGTYDTIFMTANGCDSTIILNLTVLDTSLTVLYDTICANEIYEFYGDTLGSSDLYYVVFTGFNGCDSTIVLNFTVLDTSLTVLDITICENETYNFYGQNLNITGIYDTVFAAFNGCDSTIVLNLTVLDTSQTVLDITICENETYDFYGQSLNITGVYDTVFTAFNGCDSTIVLNLNVLDTSLTILDITICENETYVFYGDSLNIPGSYDTIFMAANGCDSTILLNLNVLDTSLTVLDITICENETYDFYGQSLNITGVYDTVFVAFNGCDSTIVLNLNVLDTSLTVLDATICANDSYVFYGDTLNMTGTYDTVFTALNGCDSTIVLNLNVLDTSLTTLNISICEEESYSFYGVPLSTTGTYDTVFTALNGCDSTIVLNLNVLDTALTVLNVTICEDVTFDFYGIPLNSTGIYDTVFTGFNGCDSTIVLNLNVLDTSLTVLDVMICTTASYVFFGDTLNTTGTYDTVFTALNGCDSTIVLNLQVLDTLQTVLDVTICEDETYSFYGIPLNTTGTYDTVFMALNGCDSTIVLNLTVLDTFVTVLDVTICENESFDFYGTPLNITGTYDTVFTTTNGCDSTIILNLLVLDTVQTVLDATICANEFYVFYGDTLNMAGTYDSIFTAVNGCDSTVVLNLNVLDTSLTILNITICENENYVFYGDTLNTTGTYDTVFAAINGCDSTIVLNLNVLDTSLTTLNVNICETEHYVFFGDTLNMAGIYDTVFTAINGCDSSFVLNLNVLDTAQTVLNATICANEVYVFYGDTLNMAGTYDTVFTAVNGCDSTVVLNLNMLDTSLTTLSVTICENETYVFYGDSLNMTGTYDTVFTALNGCDSTFVLNLNVLDTALTTLNVTICENEIYDFYGDTLSLTGTYDTVFTALNGCDSTIVLQLNVLDTALTVLDATICANEVYVFYGDTLNLAGSFDTVFTALNGCDSTIVLNLNVLDTSLTILNIAICENETYVFFGDTLNMTGSYDTVFAALNGCDSTFVLNLNVLDTSLTTLNVTICENQTYDFYGDTLNMTGTYDTVFSSVNGCDSTIVLQLNVLDTVQTMLDATICANEIYVFYGDTLNLPGTYDTAFTALNGCDSTIILNLNVLDSSLTVLTATICQNETYIFYGDTLNLSGAYDTVFTAANGCDSTILLNLNVLDTFMTSFDASICLGSTYSFAGNTYDSTGVYMGSFTTVSGCDSIVVLNLTVDDTIQVNLSQTICEGDSVAFEGDIYKTTGVYTASYLTISGCDSMIVLSLTVLDTAETNIAATICANEAYDVGGFSFDTTGAYTVVLTAANGCDSTVLLSLTVLDTFETNITATICTDAVYDVGAMSFDSTGNYIVLLSAQNGCDSTVFLNLTVLDTFETTINTAICAGEVYDVGGTLFDSTDNYTVLLTAVNGCDSTVFLNLTVLDTFATILTESICAGEVYDVGGTPFDATGAYTVLLSTINGCDSTVYLSLTVLDTFETILNETLCFGEVYTVGGMSFNSTGNYTVPLSAANGCDSTVYLNLLINPVYQLSQQFSICDGDSLFAGGAYQFVSGIYTDSLQTIDGCDSLIITDLTVHSLPTVMINAPLVMCPGNPVDISVGSYSSYLWVPTGETTQQITITSAGSYSVTVTDANGCTAMDDVTILVSCDTVVSSFTVSQDTACVSHLVYFTNQSSPNATSWFWDFGNGNFSNKKDPFDIYPDTGLFTVTLIASKDLAFDTFTHQIYVYPHVIADFTYSIPDSCESEVIAYLDASQSLFPITSWEWNFGDGNIILGPNPVNVYTAFDIENVSLTITDQYNCMHTINKDVPVLDFSATSDIANAGADLRYCQLPSVVNLAATPTTVPGVGGTWSQSAAQAQAGIVIENPADPNTAVSGIQPDNDYKFSWTLSTNTCGDYSSDTVRVFAYSELLVRNDTFSNFGDPANKVLTILANDQVPNSPQISVSLITTPTEGSLTANGDGTYTFTAPNALKNDTRFTYEVCVLDCPAWCERAEVTLLAKPPVKPLLPPSNVITPNDDGTGDAVVVPNLSDFPDGVEFVVLSRWGVVVYETKNYNNNWQGLNSSGKPLPDGTYYYILRAGVQNEQVLQGTITIMR